MENLSKEARQLLNQFLKIRTSNELERIYHQEHQQLIDSNYVFVQELCDKGLVAQDRSGDVGLTIKGLYYMPEYKAFVRQTFLTSLWLPLIVSIIGTALTLLVNYWINN